MHQTADKPTSDGTTESTPRLNAEPSAAAGAFSAVAGVLGGFSVTIIVLALPPGPISSAANRDILCSMLLAAAFIYIVSAALLANSQNTHFLWRARTREKAFVLGIIAFHVGNLVFIAAFTVIAAIFSLPLMEGMAIVFSIVAAVIALTNIAGGISTLAKKNR